MSKTQSIVKTIGLFLTLIPFLGCTTAIQLVREAVPQSNDVSILEKNETLNKEKGVCVLVDIAKFTPKAYHEFKTSEIKTAFEEAGIHKYVVLENESELSDNCEYLLTLKVHNWTVKETEYMHSVLWVGATATMLDPRTRTVLCRVGGDAKDTSVSYDIGEMIASLLADMLKEMYT